MLELYAVTEDNAWNYIRTNATYILSVQLIPRHIRVQTAFWRDSVNTVQNVINRKAIFKTDFDNKGLYILRTLLCVYNWVFTTCS